MENLGFWVTPLLFLPGVALLVMSTSIRFGQIHNEFHHVLSEESPSMEVCQILYRRARLFRDALVSLYISFGLFAFASLIGGLINQWTMAARTVVALLTGGAILALVIAASMLVRESRRALHIIEAHLRDATASANPSAKSDSTHAHH